MISTLDTREVVKELKAAGFSDEQAEAVTRVVKKAQDLDFSDLATKADLSEFRADLTEFRAATRADIAALETRMTGEIARLRTDMADLRAELIKWVVGIAFAQIATIIAILKLFPAGHP